MPTYRAWIVALQALTWRPAGWPLGYYVMNDFGDLVEINPFSLFVYLRTEH